MRALLMVATHTRSAPSVRWLRFVVAELAPESVQLVTQINPPQALL